MWRRLRCRHHEDGSAIAEFVMVSALVLVLGIGVFQLGLLLYVRNTLTAAASEGARFGARADTGPAEGERRARAFITSSLSESFARDVHAFTTTTSSGVQVVEVTVRAPMPVIGLIGPSGSLSVGGRAFAEKQ